MKEVRYSDIYTNLSINPGSGQLARLTNETAVARSIRNLVLTEPGERRFSDLGARIRSILFEPMDSITANALKSLIESVIENNEPRANLIDVAVKPNELEQTYTVTIVFSIINIAEPITLSLTLERIR